MKTIINLLFLITGTIIYGADIYIDPVDNTGPYNGTCANPYNSWTQVSFSASNDYYQRCGTIENLSATLQPDNLTGSAGNRIIFGAYYKTGSLCNIGVSGAKPILNRSAPSGSVFGPDNSTYLQFENLDMRGGSSNLFLRSSSDHVVIRNCNVGLNTAIYGIRIQGSSDGEIYNNIVDSNNISGTTDGITLGSSCNRYKVYNNRVYNWRHTQIAIHSNSSDNEIYYNYASGSGCDSGNPCRGFEAFGNNSQNNKIHHNYFCNFNQHSQFLGGTSNNEVYCNIWDTTRAPAEEAFAISVVKSRPYDITGNKFYNNIFYDIQQSGSRCINLLIYHSIGIDGNIINNEFINNICYKWGTDGEGYRQRDNSGSGVGDINSNIFRNNIYYLSGDSSIVEYETANKTLSQWLALNGTDGMVISNELNEIPELRNPSLQEFWPADASSNVVGSGNTLSAPYNELLDPDNTDFTASPPIVNTVTRSDYIGAYALPGSTPDTTAPEAPTGLTIE